MPTLLELLDGQQVQAAVTCRSPGQVELTLSHRQTQPQIVRLSGAWLAVPMGLDPLRVVDPALPKNRPLEAFQKLLTQTVTRQPLVVGAVLDRGGIAGEQQITLPPGGSVRIVLPALTTRLEKFEPDAKIAYQLLPAVPEGDSPRLATLVELLAAQGASLSVGQAAVWHFTQQVPFMQLRLLKRREFNDRELALAEFLVAEVDRTLDAAGERRPLPARVYLHLVYRTRSQDEAGNMLTGDLARKLRGVAERGSLFGLPVTLSRPEDAEMPTLTDRLLGIGCQVTLSGPPEEMHAMVVISQWSGRGFEPFREFRVWLGARPSPAVAWRHIETGVLTHLLTLRSSPRPDGTPTVPPTVWLHNQFPLAVHALELRRRAPIGEAEEALLFSGYAIGPERQVRLPLDSAGGWDVTAVAWGP